MILRGHYQGDLASFSVETVQKLRVSSFAPEDAPRIHKHTKGKQNIAKQTFSDFSKLKRPVLCPKLSSQPESCAVISKKTEIVKPPSLKLLCASW